MDKFEKIISFLIGIPKTIIFNFYYFEFATAIKFPVILASNVKLMKLAGNVKLNIAKVRFGSVRIGFGDVGIIHYSNNRTTWNVSGTVIFNGKASFGYGCNINVSGLFDVGSNFLATAKSSYVVKKEVCVGSDCIFSWDVLLMDSDLHSIRSEKSGSIINQPRKIIIEDRVWVGCRVTILKGALIGAGNIVCAGAVITGSYKYRNSIISDKQKEAIKQDVVWER